MAWGEVQKGMRTILNSKQCAKCRGIKELDAFSKKRGRPDGLQENCKQCCNAYHTEWRQRNLEKCRSEGREYYARNSETIKQRVRDWAAANPQRKAASDRAYYTANIERAQVMGRAYRQRNAERIAEGKKRWKAENLEKVQQRRFDVYWSEPERYREAAGEFKRANRARYNLLHAQRKARKRNATPPWLTEDHRRVMQFTYDLAAACSAHLGQPYHVDHYVPLKGKDVCGLHVPWNLRAIPAIANLRKNNELPEELQGWRRPDGSRCG